MILTRERALEIKHRCQIIANGHPWYDYLNQVLTPTEKKELHTYWKTLPGSSTYPEAFMDYLNGTTGELG